jgi:hypothetical protein
LGPLPLSTTDRAKDGNIAADHQLGHFYLNYKVWMDSHSSKKPQARKQVMIRLLTLALLCASIVDLSSGTATPKCTRPSLRKEWRALGYDGQRAFTDAIKAGIIHFYVDTLY